MSDNGNISNFDKMVGQFKNMAELQNYCNAQYKTIAELNRQINQYKDEKLSLEKMLKDTVHALPPANIVEFPKYGVPPEEEICLQQLHILNRVSNNRELTLEEVRKCEIFSKILVNLKQVPKDIEAPSKNLSNEDLLKLASSLGEIK